jgi:hypothetical protein
MNYRLQGFMHNVLVHVIQRLVFYFNLCHFFSVPKTNPHKEVPKYIFYSRDQHFILKTWSPVIKLSVFLKKTQLKNILCLGNILRLMYVLDENTLSFSDRTLRYLMWVLYTQKLHVRGTKISFTNKRLFPEFWNKIVLRIFA